MAKKSQVNWGDETKQYLLHLIKAGVNSPSYEIAQAARALQAALVAAQGGTATSVQMGLIARSLAAWYELHPKQS